MSNVAIPPWSVEQLVDVERVEIRDTASPSYLEAVATARRGLDETGCAVVGGFLRPEAVALLNEEIAARKHATHYTTQLMSPYFQDEPNPDLPDDHPLNYFCSRTSGFLPGDNWAEDTAARTLLRAPEIAGFVADCLRIEKLYRYGDPLADVVANISEPGAEFPWHFDTPDFTVSLLVQAAEGGGVFEFVPGVRTDDDERFDAVAKLLAGSREGVHSLDLRPGDLQIFQGRHAMHRVTRVPESSRARHMLLLSYNRVPGSMGKVARTRQLYGKLLPEHEEAARSPVRADALID